MKSPNIHTAQSSSAWQTRFTFSGKEKDVETGYSYFGARYYDSDISVWLSVDPLADKYPSMSPYMYTAGNPVMLVDPDGTWVPGVDKNGNITLTAEKGDNAKSLTSYFNRKMRSRYLGTFPMLIKTGTVVTLKNDNSASKAYKHSTENSDLYTDGNSWRDRNFGYLFIDMNYNCFEFAINVVNNTNINYKSGLRTDPNTFGFFLNTYFTK